MLRVRGEGHICGSDFTPPQTGLKQVGLVPHILVSARLKISTDFRCRIDALTGRLAGLAGSVR